MPATLKDTEQFMTNEGLNCLTTIEGSEPYFTWQGCDVCNDGLGATVEDCNGFNGETKEIQDGYKVCADCLYMITYGEEIERG